MANYQIKPSLSQAVKLKKLKQEGTLTAETIDEFLSEQKGHSASTQKEDKIYGKFKSFFPSEYTAVQMGEIITQLLTDWKARTLIL
jgi:ParB family chromosome partitioning protein